ncbi:MAG: inorganic diphosphatase [Clostridiales bacterium]|jgi:inorganic pyrophosphatase|nr:inorganic diphosphatase [Clostridiales bacterium]
MNIWHDLDESRVTSDSLTAVIEISKGSKQKYELDKDTGMLILDRVLFTSTHYPANYGFIPRTLSQDGDPLDILVLCQESILPMTLVQCYPIGVLKMIDNDDDDEKIIAIPFGDPSMSCYKDISDLPLHIFNEIKHFFEVYKNLENKFTKVENILGRVRAEETIMECIELYNDKYVKKSVKKAQ